MIKYSVKGVRRQNGLECPGVLVISTIFPCHFDRGGEIEKKLNINKIYHKQMKTQKTLKALVLSLAIAIGVLLPAKMVAQTDGFFQGYTQDYTDRASSVYFTNEQFGQTYHEFTNETFGTPLGSGLLIMAAAGGAYALIRRKRK